MQPQRSRRRILQPRHRPQRRQQLRQIRQQRLQQGHVLQLISRSSVLNGGIEGPYVEEVIKAMKMNS